MSEAILHDLPRGWEWSTIGEVCHEPQYGWTTSGSSAGKVHLLRTTDITSGNINWESVPYCKEVPPQKEKYLLEDGDIVISRAGSVGFSHLIKHPKEAVFASYLIRFRPLIEERYLSSYLKSPFYWDVISEKSIGIAIPNVNATKLRQIRIPVPPLSEQHRIVAKIDELFSDMDAGVEALKKAREKLKLYRAAVLKAAVEGAHTVEWRQQHPHTEPASELLKRILVERRRRWEEEQLRIFKEKGKDQPQNWKGKYKEPDAPDTANLPPLPEGWCWAGWRQIGVSQNGRPFPSKEYVDSGIKLLRPGNLYADGSVGWNEKNTRFMPEKYARNSSDLIIEGEKLVINLTAQSLKDEFLGRVCLTKSGERCLLNQRLARLTPILVPSKYMLYVFKSSHFRKFVDELNTGSLIQHMFTSQLEKFVLPLPPLLEQKVIVEAVEGQLSVIDHIEAEIDTTLQSAQALRQAILKKAFIGKLVPQDPEDEAAAVLLERIKAEKASHAAGKKPGRRPAQRKLIYEQ